MSGVTNRAFRESDLAGHGKQQLERALRMERERRLERACERGLGEAFDLGLTLFRGR